MPFTRGGDWWNQGTRPLMKIGGGVTADVETSDLVASAVTAAKIADGVVSSEKATANLRRNSITVLAEPPAASSSEGWTSAYVVWRPGINVNVLAVHHIALGFHENATCDNWTLYGNAGTCVTDFALKAVSTGIAAGTRTASGALTQVALAADTNLTAKLNGSTCSMPGRAAFQVDYESTG